MVTGVSEVCFEFLLHVMKCFESLGDIGKIPDLRFK